MHIMTWQRLCVRRRLARLRVLALVLVACTVLAAAAQQSRLQAWLTSPSASLLYTADATTRMHDTMATTAPSLHAYASAHAVQTAQAGRHNRSDDKATMAAHDADARRGHYVVLTSHGGRRSAAWPTLRQLLMRSGAVHAHDMHVVDDTHVLVYLRTAALPLLAASLAEHDSNDNNGGEHHQHNNNRRDDGANTTPLSSWRVIDVYAPRHAASLKWSQALQMHLARAHAAAHDNKSSSSSSDDDDDDEDVDAQRVEVMVYTAAGTAGMVAHDLQHSPRLHHRGGDEDDDDSTNDDKADDDEETQPTPHSGGCHVRVLTDTAMQLRNSHVLLLVSPPLLTHASLQQQQHDEGNRSTLVEGAHEATVAWRACERVLHVIAQHPAVRWLEPRPRRAQLMNAVAASTIQGGCYSNVSSSYKDKQQQQQQQHDACAHAAVDTAALHDDTATLTYPLWQQGIRGRGEVVNIADSGLDVYSCFFHDPRHAVTYFPATSTTHRKIASYYACSVSGAAPSYGDVVDGHGTHVAGSALGASLDDQSGVCATRAATATAAAAAIRQGRHAHDGHTTRTRTAQQERYNGVAPDARIFVRDLACDRRSHSLQIPRVLDDIVAPGYAAGARIASNSWGFTSVPTREYTSAERLVDELARRYDDMLLIFAAGNRPSAGVVSPGVAKNVVTVGAHANVAACAAQGAMASYSAHGPVYDGRVKPDVVAAGGVVESARSSGRVVRATVEAANEKDVAWCSAQSHWTAFANTTADAAAAAAAATANAADAAAVLVVAAPTQCTTTRKSGTSMATAVVAGGAALLRQYLRERRGQTSPSSALLRAALVHSSVYMPHSMQRSGHGRVDLSLFVLSPPAVEVGAEGDTTAAETGDASSDATAAAVSRSWFVDRRVLRDRATHRYCFHAYMTPDDTSSNSNGSNNNSTTTTSRHFATADASAAQEQQLLKVTLAWTDEAAAAEGSIHALVHDLDVAVVDADGVVYYATSLRSPSVRQRAGADAGKGNNHGVNDDNDAAADGNDDDVVYGDTTSDHVHTTEQVRLPLTPPLARNFRVVVYGEDVQHTGEQAYALVVSAPGLRHVDNCTASFARAERESVVDSNATTATNTTAAMVRCPGDCGAHAGRGVCDAQTRTCVCAATHRFVDCSRCNDEVLCHRQGVCSASRLTCACGARGRHRGSDNANATVTHFADAHCSVCTEGWYGPACDSRCACQHGGVCNTTTGLCICPNTPSGSEDKKSSSSSSAVVTATAAMMTAARRDDDSRHHTSAAAAALSSCFAGASCEHCCRGHGGAQCNERSYWCDTSGAEVRVDDVAGGYVTVRGDGLPYAYSVTCRWAIVAPAVGWHVELDYLWRDMQSPYHTLELYTTNSSDDDDDDDTKDDSDGQSAVARRVRVRSDTGTSNKPVTVRIDRRRAWLVFSSDWTGARRGFLLRYRLVPPPTCNITCQPPHAVAAATMTRTTTRAAGLPAEQRSAHDDGPNSSHMMCGAWLQLPQWCVCTPPYIGYNCQVNTRHASTTTAMMTPTSLPRLAHVHNNNTNTVMTGEAAIATLTLLAHHTTSTTTTTAATAAKAAVVAGGVWRSHRDSVVQLPLTVNGLSVLRVRVMTASNTTAAAAAAASAHNATLAVQLTVVLQPSRRGGVQHHDKASSNRGRSVHTTVTDDDADDHDAGDDDTGTAEWLATLPGLTLAAVPVTSFAHGNNNIDHMVASLLHQQQLQQQPHDKMASAMRQPPSPPYTATQPPYLCALRPCTRGVVSATVTVPLSHTDTNTTATALASAEVALLLLWNASVAAPAQSSQSSSLLSLSLSRLPRATRRGLRVDAVVVAAAQTLTHDAPVTTTAAPRRGRPTARDDDAAAVAVTSCECGEGSNSGSATTIAAVVRTSTRVQRCSDDATWPPPPLPWPTRRRHVSYAAWLCALAACAAAAWCVGAQLRQHAEHRYRRVVIDASASAESAARECTHDAHNSSGSISGSATAGGSGKRGSSRGSGKGGAAHEPLLVEMRVLSSTLLTTPASPSTSATTTTTTPSTGTAATTRTTTTAGNTTAASSSSSTTTMTTTTVSLATTPLQPTQ